MNEVRIAVVDDHPLLATGMAALFKRTPGYRLVACGGSAADIVKLTKDCEIDVLVVDLNMPGDAFAAIAESRKIAPGIKIVVFTASNNTDHAVTALERGANAYIQKGESADELLEAIEKIVEGEIYISPHFAAKVINALNQAKIADAVSKDTKFSVRENQIIKLLFLGKRNREIAATLSLSERTVKAYLGHLMQKLKARNRLEVVIAARRMTEFSADAGDPPVRPAKRP